MPHKIPHIFLLLLPLTHAQTPAPPDQPAPPPIIETKAPADAPPATAVTDAERSAVAITAFTLDLHLVPAEARAEARATLTLRNTSPTPLARVPLQLSSSLHWLTISAATSTGLQPLPFTQSPVATDADHTGYAREAVLTPAAPLAAGATLKLSVFYAGTIAQSSDRLELLGAPHGQAALADWDAIAPTSDGSATALRGFGNVLWYPVAAPTARLGDGNRLFDLVARERRRNTAVSMALRLTVEYVGDPPDAAIFNGSLQPLTHAADDQNQLVDDSHGIATADFPATPLGFRTPSLFLTAQHARNTPDQTLSLVTPQPEAVAPYAAAAASIAPLLTAWLGPTPRSPLLLLDRPGQPLEDAAFLAGPLRSSATAKAIAPDLVRGLAHAWFRPQIQSVAPGNEWLDQGLAEFLTILWTEHSEGREAALAALRQASVLIALAEPASPITPASGPVLNEPQPLTEASSDVFLHLKAAYVFWQLRELVGEAPLRATLIAYRHSLAVNPAAVSAPRAFQTLLEGNAKTDLGWFFDDWVYHDRGLPDLTIVQATPRPMPARAGKSAGFLVAVEVRNDGDAAADVPATVRSGTLSSTERLRIPAHSSASTRILFEGQPETLQVNDGSVPEQRTTTHTLHFTP